MKRFIIALLATSFLAAPGAFAAPQDRNDGARGRTVERHTTTIKKTEVRKNRWARGHRLSPAERRRTAEVRDYRRYRLNAPPRGQRWVKVDNDFLLISVATGVIVGLASSR
ncbi:Ni/Co efflux regulator RcnB [Rhizobium sp. PP-WC-2G-219]|nr:Ni/Co efflux regulator RcnB [Rhizobium sp. PP-CC-3A-592]PYE44813.1 Ni/Co efflux regulator RcnB [Rhizobium sp. PP-F2F-G20b]TCL94022.1 Ni/Co efflux regulator RcnB [Rhizobium sp. PP-WC-2G-219]